MAEFIYPWTRRDFETHQAAGKNVLHHVASGVFRKRGMAKGDLLYIVACFDDKVHLMGRLDVDAVLDSTEAAKRFRGNASKYDAQPDHAVCAKGEEGYLYFGLVIPNDLVAKLKFASGAKPRMKESAAGPVPDGQTFRTLRELSADAVEMLETLRLAYEDTLPD